MSLFISGLPCFSKVGGKTGPRFCQMWIFTSPRGYVDLLVGISCDPWPIRRPPINQLFYLGFPYICMESLWVTKSSTLVSYSCFTFIYIQLVKSREGSGWIKMQVCKSQDIRFRPLWLHCEQIIDVFVCGFSGTRRFSCLKPSWQTKKLER